MKKLLFIVSMLVVIVSPAQSQNTLLDYWKAEKIKISPEQVNLIREGKLKPEDLKPKGEDDELLGDKDNQNVTRNSYPESEITAAINPTDKNNMVVSAIRFTGSNFECPIYYTKDFGATWTESIFKISAFQTGTAVGGGDPVLCYAPDGTLYYSWIMVYIKSNFDSLVAETRWAYSTDGGKIWNLGSDPYIGRSASVYNASGYNLPFLFDKQWMVCDYSNGSNRGNLYASVTDLVSGIGNAGIYSQQGIYVGVKKAGDAKFDRKLINVSQGFNEIQFSSIDCDNRGRVYVSFWAHYNGAHSLWCIYSDDAFKTHSGAKKISSFKFNANAQLYPDGGLRVVPGISSSRAYPYPQIKVDRSGGKYDGNVYATWCAVGINSLLGNGLDIYFSRSTDRGNSWSAPQSINIDKLSSYSHQFYPTIDVSPSGDVIVNYYDNERVSNLDNTDYVSSVSYDGGYNFINRTILSNVQTDFQTVGQQNKGFGIGEYNGLVSTNEFIIPFWCDGRNDDGRLKIYTTHFPVDSVPGIPGYKPQIIPVNPSITNLEVNNFYNRIYVSFKSDNPITASYSIYDIKFKLVDHNDFSVINGSNSLEIGMADVSADIYYIVFNFDGNLINKSFLIQGR